MGQNESTMILAQGELLEADARLVVAPGTGIFEPTYEVAAGEQVRVGQVLGHVHSGVQSTPVISPFSGQAGAPLAWPGERLTTHQPVMWLSVAAVS